MSSLTNINIRNRVLITLKEDTWQARLRHITEKFIELYRRHQNTSLTIPEQWTVAEHPNNGSCTGEGNNQRKYVRREEEISRPLSLSVRYPSRISSRSIISLENITVYDFNQLKFFRNDWLKLDKTWMSNCSKTARSGAIFELPFKFVEIFGESFERVERLDPSSFSISFLPNFNS